MENFSIGQKLVLNNKEYTIIGIDKKSYILEKDGKKFKATSVKLQKILNQSSTPKVYSNVTRRVKYKQLFDKSAKMPETKEDCIKWCTQLVAELSPENLCCDGEASKTQILAKRKEIKATWKELEQICGEKINLQDFDLDY
jgi:hypothetical protein